MSIMIRDFSMMFQQMSGMPINSRGGIYKPTGD